MFVVVAGFWFVLVWFGLLLFCWFEFRFGAVCLGLLNCCLLWVT